MPSNESTSKHRRRRQLRYPCMIYKNQWWVRYDEEGKKDRICATAFPSRRSHAKTS